MLLKKAGEKLDDEEKRHLNVIRDNAAKMKQLLDNLLSFSRWSNRVASFSIIDMLQLVNEVWKNLSQVHSDRRINLTIELLPPAYGDAVLIRQVVTNLLSNAIKFTSKKDIALIHIGATSGDSENVYFVRDNGAGFDMNHYHKLFGVFQRLHSSEEYEGNGAGLAIVQRLINRHGGKVWADSKIDEETTFFFTLPKAAKT
jgi:two-component system sensor kinase